MLFVNSEISKIEIIIITIIKVYRNSANFTDLTIDNFVNVLFV